jgi:TonB family protein
MNPIAWLLSVALAQDPSSEERLPVLTSQPAPVYPADALAQGQGAVVVLLLDVDAEGRVVNAEVTESAGAGFDASALQAAYSFRFEPALDARGRPVAARIGYRYVFEATRAAEVAVEGRVLDPLDEVPVERATVRLLGEDGVEQQIAFTDADGRFAFAGLPAGAWSLDVTFPGRVAAAAEVDVEPGKAATVTLYLPTVPTEDGEADLVVRIEAPPVRVGITERVLTTEEIRYLPGTAGDVVRVVQNLPGVARPPLGVGQLIIRGVDPEDSSYALDGGPIPLVFHFSGLTTVMPSDAVAEVAFLPGSYSVRYGRTLGGLVDLRTSGAIPEVASRSYLSVDVYQAAMFSEWRLGEKAALTFSGRRSYIDAVLNPILNQGESAIRAPRYYDAQLRLRAVDDAGGRWDALLLMSDDRFRVLGSKEEDAAVTIGLSTAFQKLRLQRVADLGGGVVSETVLIGGPENQEFKFQETGTAYERPFTATFRQEVRRDAADGESGFRLGLDVLGGVDRYLYDVGAFGQKEQGSTFLVAPAAYGELTIPVGPLQVIPGLRGDALFFEDGAILSADPRVAVRWPVGPTTTLKAATGRHSQMPETRQLLDEGDGVPTLRPEWSLQSSLGVEQQVTPGLRVEVTAFHNELFDLVSGRETSFRFFTGPPPSGPFDTGAYANDGRGRVLGVEGLVKLQTEKTVGLLAVTSSHSTRRDRPDAERELFRYDQPLTLNLLGSHELSKGWRLGARVRTSSGYPYTPVVQRIYDLDSRSFAPVYGERDSARLPMFFALDVRVDKKWTYRWGELNFYLDLQNATNTTNPEVMGWTWDYSEEDPVESIPALPAFGLRAEW